jgi:ribonuclease R
MNSESLPAAARLFAAPNPMPLWSMIVRWSPPWTDSVGRKIDFRLVREGEELAGRGARDKGGGGSSSGAPAQASAKRAGRKTAAAPGEHERSPIQALKASVKKAAAQSKGLKGPKGKPRKTRR